MTHAICGGLCTYSENVEAPNSCVYTVAGSRKCKWKDQLTRCENGRRTDGPGHELTTLEVERSLCVGEQVRGKYHRGGGWEGE